MAACEALRNNQYYVERWKETRELRNELCSELKKLDWDVIEGCANFLLCQLPQNQPESKSLISACEKHNLYLRDVSNMGKCFDNRSLRIAVKDRETNRIMIQIIKFVLSEFENIK
jgi:histidinol-phosphate/aromatic aminotransferase/cobyric acid decarboxylase-like protein